MKLLLTAKSNPDHPYDRVNIKPHFVEVSSIAEASKTCRDFIDKHELGGGNWCDGAGYVLDNGKHIARISYNGRAWEAGFFYDPRREKPQSDPPFQWDLMIAHPPCTHLAVSGARWFKDKQQEQAKAIDFFMALINAPIPRICVENPVSIMSTHYRKPDQIIQPWQFGHGEIKATCLWLKNLPTLTPTDVVSGRIARVHREPPSLDRWKNRSRTLSGIAAAMAEQWSAKAITK